MKKLFLLLALCLCTCTSVERGLPENGKEPLSARAIVLEFTPWLEIQPWWVGGPTIDLKHVQNVIEDQMTGNEMFTLESTDVSEDTLYFPFWVREYSVNGYVTKK